MSRRVRFTPSSVYRIAPLAGRLAARFALAAALIGGHPAAAQSGGGAAPSNSPQAPPPAFVLESLRLGQEGADSVITFASSGLLGLVGVQPDPDGSLVVQLPNHDVAASIHDLFPETGPVLAVRVTVEQTARGPFARAVVTPRSPITYSFHPEGRELELRLRPAGALSPAVEALGLRQRIAALERELAASREERDRLNARIGTLKNDRDLLAGRFEELEVRRHDLEAALEATLDEIQALADSSRQPSTSEEAGAIRRERDDLAQRVAELTDDLTRARTAQEESDAQIQVWRAELDRVEQGAPVTGDERTVAELRQRLDQALADKAGLQNELAAARTTGVSRGRTRGGVHLRQGPGTDTESLALLAEGISLEVLGRQGDWIHVRAGSRDGWVYGLLIELESETVSRLQTALAEAESEKQVLAGRVAALDAEDTGNRLGELEAANAALRDEVDHLRTEGVERASTTSEANLRQAPGLEAPVLATLRPKTTVEILDRSGEWLKVRAGADQGWVYEKLLTLESEVIAELRDELAALRSERDAAPDQAGHTSASDAGNDAARRLAIVEAERDALRQELAKARRANANSTAASTDPAASAPIPSVRGEATPSRGRTLTGVHLREAPSVESRSMMLIPAETTVELLRLEQGWYRVRQGTAEGWVFADLLTPESEEIARLENELGAARREIVRLQSSAATPRGESAEAPSDVAWVLQNVHLRDQPGMDHAILGVLEAGSRVTVLEANGPWHRVRAGQLEGWVYRDFLGAGATPPTTSVSQTASKAAPHPAGAATSPTANSPLPPATPLPREPALPAAGTPARTVARVFLRTGPGADQESIALISEDTLIQVLEERGDWRRVVVRGTEGWMYGPLLAPLD